MTFPKAALCGALIATFAAAAAPARAEFSYLSPAQTKARQCQDTRNAGSWAESLPICLSAAALFKRLGDDEKRNPWYSYEVQGEMLEAAAVDYAGLGRHRESLDTAIDAHRLLLYVYKTYAMDDDDRTDIAAVTTRLARLEVQERQALK
jgi:hypothetical protein